jgi:hypothetical protein
VNRAERRQRSLGRTPIVVALPTAQKKQRVRKVTRTLKQQCAMVTIDNGRPEDSKAVVKLMQDYLERTGNTPLTIDPTCPMICARHKLTEELLGFLSAKPIPPGELYIENFHTVQGPLGRAAARALLERLYSMPVQKVCIVRSDNLELLNVLSHYGMVVLGYYLKGPIHGAPLEAVAAAPQSEAI